jgi:hypothetical protein
VGCLATNSTIKGSNNNNNNPQVAPTICPKQRPKQVMAIMHLTHCNQTTQQHPLIPNHRHPPRGQNTKLEQAKSIGTMWLLELHSGKIQIFGDSHFCNLIYFLLKIETGTRFYFLNKP